MGILDTIKDKAGDLAEDAERAGKIGAAQVKLKSLQGNVDKELQLLGREAFELVDRGDLRHEGLDAAVSRVRDAKRLVAEKEAEIAQLKAEG